mgnify:CR=1 FL=1
MKLETGDFVIAQLGDRELCEILSVQENTLRLLLCRTELLEETEVVEVEDSVVLANMGKVQFANLDSAAQEFSKINTALRELQEGGVAKSQSSIQNRENHRRNFRRYIGGR